MIMRKRTGEKEVKVGPVSTEPVKGPFANLLEEKGKRLAQLGINISPAVTQIVNAWKKIVVTQPIELERELCEQYTAEITQGIQGIRYTSGDITEFSKMLVGLQANEENFGLKAGLFLRALINNSPEQEFRINTLELGRKVTCLGFKNTKNVFVEGGLGWGAAFRMISGRLEVSKFIGSAGGRGMEGGELIVHGHARKQLGVQMTGGKITAHGTVTSAGHHGKSGEIHIENDPNVYLAITHGVQIYVQGKLVNDK